MAIIFHILSIAFTCAGLLLGGLLGIWILEKYPFIRRCSFFNEYLVIIIAVIGSLITGLGFIGISVIYILP